MLGTIAKFILTGVFVASVASSGYAETITISDETSCEGAGFSWSGGSCNATSPYTVSAGDTLDLQASFTTASMLTNEGTITIASNSYIIVLAEGTLTNKGAVNGSSFVAVASKGTLVNDTGGTLSINFSMPWRVPLLVSGATFTNKGSATIVGRFTLHTGSSLINDSGGSLSIGAQRNNIGGSTSITNYGSITNSGTMQFGPFAGTLNNVGSITNNSGASISIRSPFSNIGGGSFSNAGEIQNHAVVLSVNNLAGGSFVNNATLYGTVVNSGNITNNAILGLNPWVSSNNCVGSDNPNGHSQITNSGKITNATKASVICGYASIQNQGEIDNPSGTIKVPSMALFNNGISDCSSADCATVKNARTLFIEGVMTNGQAHCTQDGSQACFTVYNAGNLVNNGTFNNGIGSCIVPSGSIMSCNLLRNFNILNNTGAITNHYGIIRNSGTFTSVGSATITGAGLFFSVLGQVNINNISLGYYGSPVNSSFGIAGGSFALSGTMTLSGGFNVVCNSSDSFTVAKGASITTRQFNLAGPVTNNGEVKVNYAALVYTGGSIGPNGFTGKYVKTSVGKAHSCFGGSFP